MGAVAGPVFGPVVGGFAAAAEGWRWPIWELAWISGFSSIFLSIFLPETLGDTILLKRAQRLRKLTGNQNLRSLSEIKQSEMTARAVAREYLVRPFQLMLEPAVLFINLYVGRKCHRLNLDLSPPQITDWYFRQQLPTLSSTSGSKHSHSCSSISTTSKVVLPVFPSSALSSEPFSRTSSTCSTSDCTSTQNSRDSTGKSSLKSTFV
jgi:hypothetical protein